MGKGFDLDHYLVLHQQIEKEEPDLSVGMPDIHRDLPLPYQPALLDLGVEGLLVFGPFVNRDR